MKTVLITISKDIIRRNILDTDFWPTLCTASSDLRIVLVVEAGQEAQYEKSFGSENVTVVGYKKEPHTGWRGLLYFLARTGIRSRSNIFHRWHAYTRGRAGLFVTLYKSFMSNTFARTRWYKQLIRALLVRTRQPHGLELLLDKYQPDLVFAPSLIDIDIDAPLALAAQRRGIKVVGMVRSWDNMSHHGLFTIVPERLLLQNRWLKKAAQTFQSIYTEDTRMNIVGLPHYDLYVDPTPHLKGRETFLRELGLDPQKKLIFLAGTEYAYLEMFLPRRLEEMIESSEIRVPAQVLFRPHPSPKVDSKEYGVEKMRHVKLDKAYIMRGKKLSADTGEFIQLMHYTDVVVNICSTLSIDAAAFGTPAIALGFDDPELPQKYWTSTERFNEYFDHQRHLMATGGVRGPRSLGELAQDINMYLENPSADHEGRKRILEEFVEPFDGKAGKRLASALSSELKSL